MNFNTVLALLDYSGEDKPQRVRPGSIPIRTRIQAAKYGTCILFIRHRDRSLTFNITRLSIGG